MLTGTEYVAETPAITFRAAQEQIQGDNPSTPPKTRPGSPTPPSQRTRIVVVGLGMVGISFIEKLLERDAIQKQYSVIVLGEEKHVAYNRVGLTSFFGTPASPIDLSDMQNIDQFQICTSTRRTGTLSSISRPSPIRPRRQ
jgi:hypothetical protein